MVDRSMYSRFAACSWRGDETLRSAARSYVGATATTPLRDPAIIWLSIINFHLQCREGLSCVGGLGAGFPADPRGTRVRDLLIIVVFRPLALASVSPSATGLASRACYWPRVAGCLMIDDYGCRVQSFHGNNRIRRSTGLLRGIHFAA